MVPAREAECRAAVAGGRQKRPVLFKPATGSTGPKFKDKGCRGQNRDRKGSSGHICSPYLHFLLKFLCFLFFVTLISLWPIADCGGRNEPGLAGPSCFLPGTGGRGELLFPVQMGLNTMHQTCRKGPFMALDPLLSSKNSRERRSEESLLSLAPLCLGYWLCRLDPTLDLTGYAASISAMVGMVCGAYWVPWRCPGLRNLLET